MASEVWYRKWRPQTFADVAGQQHITVTLARAVALNRVAHAYLFCGPRGTGKTSTARILAKAVNCEQNQDGQPCTLCESCRSIAEARALDLIEMDAASNRGIDEIRGLRDRVGFSPSVARYKVYLIDEVHELTQFAFDALLKTLEEPPPHVIFILATTEAHKVPETILSRCQRFDFVRIKVGDVVGRLEQICAGEGVAAERGALEAIARRSTGSLRDAVNLLEQMVALHGEKLTEAAVRAAAGLAGDVRAVELVRQIIAADAAAALDLVTAVRDDGGDLRRFTADAITYLRLLLLVRAGATASLELGEEALAELRSAAGSAEVPSLLRIANLFTRIDFRADPQSPLPLELAIIESVQPAAPAPLQAEPAVASSAGARPGRPSQPVTPAPERAAESAITRLRQGVSPRVAPPTPISVARAPAPREEAGDSAPPSPSALAPAPAAEPQPAAAAPVPSSEPEPAAAELQTTLEGARRRFRELYDRCKALDAAAARVLNGGGCDIVEVGPGLVVIGLQHASMVGIATRNHLPALQQVVAETFGDGTELRLQHVPGVESRLRALAAERPSHLLDEAIKLGAKPVGTA